VNLSSKRIRALIVAATVVAGLAAGASAYWMGSGSGNADAIVGSPNQLTLTAGPVDAQLVPNDVASVDVLATNSNPYFVTIYSLALGGGGIEVDAAHSGCSTSAIHFVQKAAPVGIFGPGWRVPPKVGATDGVLDITILGALTMDANAADACQGADFTVHLTAGTS
jgi:hypothetical protein